MKEKIIVSACLLGQQCRYDGCSKTDEKLLEKLKAYEVLPFCPEAPVFGTPRDRISVIKSSEGLRIKVDKTAQDVTSELEDEIAGFLERDKLPKKALLKSKSPSCGYQTTPILDDNLQEVEKGSGIAARMFEKKGIKIVDENAF